MLFSNEIIINIFNSFFDEIYISKNPDKNKIITIRNIRCVSREFNILISLVIRETYSHVFNSHIVLEIGSGIWKDLVRSCLIFSIAIDNECEIKKKDLVDSNLMKIWLAYVGLGEIFSFRYRHLKYGMRIYRKSLVKNYEMSSIDLSHGGEFARIKFISFYNKNLKRYYRYRCYRVDKLQDFYSDDVFEKYVNNL